METSLVKIERTCLFCSSFPGCPIFLKMGRALEAFDGDTMQTLYYTLSEVCEFFGKYQEDPQLKSRLVEHGILRRIVEAAQEKKIIVLGKIYENGTGSRIVSAFLQGIYNTPEEAAAATADAFNKDIDVVLLKELSCSPSSLFSDLYSKE